MNPILESYRETINALLGQIALTQADSIGQAAQILCSAICEGRRIHVLGAGAHSQIAVEEVLWRAGGLAAWDPILEPGTHLMNGAKRSIHFERMTGYGTAVLEANRIGETPREVLILVDAYGISSMSVDIVQGCRRRGVYTIGVSSPAYGRATPLDSPLRHPSGKNLCDEVDLLLDSHVPLGDATVTLPGLSQSVGSTSSFCSCFIMNALMIETVRRLIACGQEPPVFMSANLPGGDAANARWEEKYAPAARFLF
mgnify:CR=1 FL=1